jgi:hypothetical protein
LYEHLHSIHEGKHYTSEPRVILILHVDTVIANFILKKGTRGGVQVGFGIIPNVLSQTSFKVVMTSRFLTLLGFLSLLTYTGLFGGLEHLKIQTRLIDERL